LDRFIALRLWTAPLHEQLEAWERGWTDCILTDVPHNLERELMVRGLSRKRPIYQLVRGTAGFAYMGAKE
jgi:hypothetical protein